MASLVLGVPILPERVPSLPAITSKDVEISIKTKQDLTSIVVGSWLIDLQDNPAERKLSQTPEKILRPQQQMMRYLYA